MATSSSPFQSHSQGDEDIATPNPSQKEAVSIWPLGYRIQSPRLEIVRLGISLRDESSAVANQRHRGSQGVSSVLFSAVALFAVALTWRLTIGDRPQS